MVRREVEKGKGVEGGDDEEGWGEDEEGEG